MAARRALPFFHVEGIYENEPVGAPTTSECLLDQIYYPILLGARGHVFGNRPIWFFGTGWQAALGSQGAKFMQHAAALFDSHQGWGLVPDIERRIVTEGEGTVDTPDFAAAARTPDGVSVLIYVPTARTLQVDTTQLPGAQTSAKWYDPRTGQQMSAGSFANGARRNFTTPAGGPWLLLLEDASVVPSPAGCGTRSSPSTGWRLRWSATSTGTRRPTSSPSPARTRWRWATCTWRCRTGTSSSTGTAPAGCRTSGTTGSPSRPTRPW